MIELPTNNSCLDNIIGIEYPRTLKLEELENLEPRWLDEDHFALLGTNGNEKLYCKIQGECAALDQCIYQYYVDNNLSLNHLNS